MAYFDHDDSFYSASTTPEEFNLYPFLQHQMLATTEEAFRRAAPTFAGSWATVDQPGSSTASPTNLLATSYGEQSSRPSVNPCLMHVSQESVSPAFDTHPPPLHGSYWPITSQSTQSNHHGASSRDKSLAGGQEWETAMQTLTLNPSKYHTGFGSSGLEYSPITTSPDRLLGVPSVWGSS